jgi:hypothetical protein
MFSAYLLYCGRLCLTGCEALLVVCTQEYKEHKTTLDAHTKTAAHPINDNKDDAH